MKIIYQGGYSADELAAYRLTIYKNLVDCAKALVAALRKFNIEPDIEVNKVSGALKFSGGGIDIFGFRSMRTLLTVLKLPSIQISLWTRGLWRL